ncbi:hypothetical protein [Microseira wollei]|uniref:Uncharacterized protein n=1 Tax=Microseira wollei NIES-4236 TaxID=2530354 RepID=A0AAV3X8J6_9CYAN|nr:hypothetical protein [Microseira wollei]GET38493.1 hypothetical protein MiSe_32510 [Microseira wollei NIES-4236]
MLNKNNAERVFLEIGFRSPEREGSLRSIELLGLPGQKLKNNECVVSEKVQQFFDDLIVRKIFRQSRRIPDCNFEYIKIWLYDTEIGDAERGYAVPKIDKGDLKISSNVLSSKLERIYVLDNELTGREYDRWKEMAEKLFSPLFRDFIAPPELPDILADNPFAKFV